MSEVSYIHRILKRVYCNTINPGKVKPSRYSLKNYSMNGLIWISGPDRALVYLNYLLMCQVNLKIFKQGKYFSLYFLSISNIRIHTHTQEILVEHISHFPGCQSKINEHYIILKDMEEPQNKNIHKNWNDKDMHVSKGGS